MKKNLIITVFLLFSAFVFSQKPVWIQDNSFYPKEKYLAGFAISTGNETPEFIKSLKASAKAELIEGISVSLASAKQLTKSESAGVFSEDYLAVTASFANADINGLKTDYYYDKNEKTGYAVAYADRSEVKGYYKANISFIIQKIETATENAQLAEDEGNKGRAKKLYEEILPMFAELPFAQSLLIAIEGGETKDAQIAKSLSLKSGITQAIARLQTAIIVYVLSNETNFGKKVSLLAPKLKAELSEHGCSFTDNVAKADYLLMIKASTRKGNEVEGIYFSYLDAEISLTEIRTAKEIYGNNFTDLKGGALDFEKAGLKAYGKGLEKITAEIVKNLEK